MGIKTWDYVSNGIQPKKVAPAVKPEPTVKNFLE
jgi:hypothetical protein